VRTHHVILMLALGILFWVFTLYVIRRNEQALENEGYRRSIVVQDVEGRCWRITTQGTHYEPVECPVK
jgi:hypothetical protein